MDDTGTIWTDSYRDTLSYRFNSPRAGLYLAISGPTVDTVERYVGIVALQRMLLALRSKGEEAPFRIGVSPDWITVEGPGSTGYRYVVFGHPYPGQGKRVDVSIPTEDVDTVVHKLERLRDELLLRRAIRDGYTREEVEDQGAERSAPTPATDLAGMVQLAVEEMAKFTSALAKLREQMSAAPASVTLDYATPEESRHLAAQFAALGTSNDQARIMAHTFMANHRQWLANQLDHEFGNRSVASEWLRKGT